MTNNIVFKTKPRVIVDTYEIEAITNRMTYIYGDFLKLRGSRPKDARHFAKCPACQKKHDNSDRVYSAFNCKKNGKHIGNLFACQYCFDKYASNKLNKE